MNRQAFDPKPRKPSRVTGVMQPSLFSLDKKEIAIRYFYTFVFNTGIALFLSAIGFSPSLWSGLVFSHCIGTSICTLVLIAHPFIKDKSTFAQIAFIFLAIFNGALFGYIVASLIMAKPLPLLPDDNFSHLLQALYISLVCGISFTYFILSMAKIAVTKNQMQKERIVRINAEKKNVEAQLRLLQAQIEPHFLFNTLSNIISLLENDQQRAKAMLMDLNAYLRASLAASRQSTTTVGREMDLIRFYLNLFKVRMGDRLTYAIDVQDGVLDACLPPMLIQPLVENALKHGLEPKIKGGRVDIRVSTTGATLHIEINDTGIGFTGSNHNGFGLSNIVERLDALYGNQARLYFKENNPSGVKAVLEMPYGKN